ncbi:uncharacterized protein [Rutidosis leptorrhynchoides]|uniref:uncharacterized protein n=1 Tax=Rutidosis leptorrhynchoides TaxID=125765 RepID=UPI003A98FAE5
MATTSQFSFKKQTKSLSLPCRSHPTTFQIEELLDQMKTTASMSFKEGNCYSLLMLTRLYKCMDSLMNSSTTQVLMSNRQNKKWVDELVDESANFLDICGIIREMLSEFKDQSSDLQCALRRRKGDIMFIEKSITKYNCFRKKMKKDVKRLIARLKHNMITNGGSVYIDQDNLHLAAVMKAIIGVSEMNVVVFESLLMFLCGPVSRPNKWSIVVSKLMKKGMVACEGQQEQGVVNEFEKTDVALQMLCKNEKSSELGNFQIAQCRLERLGVQIENMESGLECAFRYLVRNRVTLLNIISH